MNKRRSCETFEFKRTATWSTTPRKYCGREKNVWIIDLAMQEKEHDNITGYGDLQIKIGRIWEEVTIISTIRDAHGATPSILQKDMN